MVTRGERYYWQVVLGVAVALVLIPSSKPDGEWLGISCLSGRGYIVDCHVTYQLHMCYPLTLTPVHNFQLQLIYVRTKMVVLEPVQELYSLLLSRYNHVATYELSVNIGQVFLNSVFLCFCTHGCTCGC